MRNKLATFTCFAIFLCLINLPANASNIAENLKNREKKGMLVPSYCKARLKDSFPEITKQQEAEARKFLGGSFVHVHHFCDALIYIWDMEAEGKVPNKVKANQAIKGITYFYSSLPKNHAVMRDVHRAYSTAYRYLGDHAKSNEHYKKMLQAF